MTTMVPSSRVPALVLHVTSVARQVCPSAGAEHLDNNDGATCAPALLRYYFAPEAVGPINQEVVRPTQYRRAYQPIDNYIPEFDLLRRRAESEMKMGAELPEQCITMLRM